MDVQQKQRLIDLPKTVAGGVATPLAALLTSRFGVAGTMVGLALSAVIVTVIADTLKVYLARVPGAVVSIPGDLKKKSALGRLLVRLRLPFSKLASLSPQRRRPILIRGLVGAAIMFIVGLVIVTGVELGVGKNLSCWVWNNCYTESSADGENASDASGLPSIFVATNRLSSASAPQGGPAVPQQQPAPPAPVAPPTSPASPSASGKGSQPSVSQQPSAPPSEQQSSQSPSESPRYQQQSADQPQSADQQQSPTSNPESVQQSFSSSSETQQQQPSGSEQQSPTPSEGVDQGTGA